MKIIIDFTELSLRFSTGCWSISGSVLSLKFNCNSESYARQLYKTCFNSLFTPVRTSVVDEDRGVVVFEGYFVIHFVGTPRKMDETTYLIRFTGKFMPLIQTGGWREGF